MNAISDYFVVGEIKEVGKHKLNLLTPSGEEVEVVFDEGTKLPFGSKFEVGERIRAIGDWTEDTFEAEGIGKGGLRWKMMSSPMPAPGVKGYRNPPLRMK